VLYFTHSPPDGAGVSIILHEATEQEQPDLPPLKKKIIQSLNFICASTLSIENSEERKKFTFL